MYVQYIIYSTCMYSTLYTVHVCTVHYIQYMYVQYIIYSTCMYSTYIMYMYYNYYVNVSYNYVNTYFSCQINIRKYSITVNTICSKTRLHKNVQSFIIINYHVFIQMCLNPVHTLGSKYIGSNPRQSKETTILNFPLSSIYNIRNNNTPTLTITMTSFLHHMM